MIENGKIPAIPQRPTLRKHERLSGRKIMTALFTKGKIVVVSPFRLVWMVTPLSSSSPAQIAFGVPVKNFRLAVDRNLVKRQMREVYRKNKSTIYSMLREEQTQCAIMIVFTGKSKLPFNEVENKLRLILQRFEFEFKKHAQ